MCELSPCYSLWIILYSDILYQAISYTIEMVRMEISSSSNIFYFHPEVELSALKLTNQTVCRFGMSVFFASRLSHHH